MRRLSLWEEFVLSRREVSEKVEPVGGAHMFILFSYYFIRRQKVFDPDVQFTLIEVK